VLGLSTYDRAQVHLARLSARDLLAVTERILALPVAERRKLAVMHPGRADVIGGGALVLACVVRRLGVGDLLVSEHDLLDGIAWSLA
jgi:exopolyphosphatase/guanosine-5'-triphosphate,3'-diphosphate pyrophosphatase